MAPRLRRKAEALGVVLGEKHTAGATKSGRARRENPYEIFDRVITVLEERHDQTWRRSAACRGTPTAKFFSSSAATVDQAKAICATCPVAANCLADNLNVPHGVFGGLDVDERSVLKNSDYAA